MSSLLVLTLFVLSLSAQDVPIAHAATILVTNTTDSDTGSLRAAIIEANGSPGGDLIEFRIPGTGTHTITPLTPLPAITSIVTITGETEEGWVAATATTAAVLRVELSGATSGGIGLTMNGVGSVVRGLAINQFSTGIRANVNDIVIAGNHIGTSLSGLTDLGNTTVGIDCDTAVGIIVGGLTPADRNVISGNGGDGVELHSVNLASVLGNYIGTDATGLAPLQNDGDGVQILPGSNNFIGDDVAGARNVIAGNFGHGINITSDSGGNTVQGNYIGVKADGTGAVAAGAGVGGEPGRNNNAGINVASSSSIDTIIGGTTAAARNIISGNQNGIVNSSSGPLLVQGNYIGLDPTGTFAIGNVFDGIFGSAITLSRFGSSAIGGGNVISGNGDDGIQSGTRVISVQGNIIGLNAARTTVIANGGWGINNYRGLVGGTGAGESNTIIGNTLGGIFSANIQARALGNAIYNNGGLGIDIDPVGVRANTNNGSANFPIITAGAVNGGGLTVSGILDSSANTVNFQLYFYANTVCDPSGNGEGELYLGSTLVSTNASGDGTFTNVALQDPGSRRFLTATSVNPSGATMSEFSTCFELPNPAVTGTIAGSVALQGRGSAPNALWAIPLAVTLTASGNPPFYNATVTTTTSGGFTIPSVPVGTYALRVKNAHTLSCQINVTVVAGSNTALMGTLREGDVDNNDLVNILDFSALATSFGLTSGQGGFNINADFNSDAIVNITDFSLLATSFGQSGGGTCP